MQPDGSLDESTQEMLKGMGEWMRINGEGIYGSRAWKTLGEGANGRINPLPAGFIGAPQANCQFGTADFRFTAGRDGSIYAFCLAVPGPGVTVNIVSMGSAAKLLPSPVKTVALLGSSDPLRWEQKPGGLEITCPGQMPCRISAVFRVTCE
jgi:alpha-L-fucosidase